MGDADQISSLASEDLDRDLASLCTPLPAHDLDEQCLGPLRYLQSTGGKGVRNLIIDAMRVWCDVPDESVAKVKHVVDLLHSSSLLMDDVQDKSLVRRGHPTAHRIFGKAEAINCSSYVLTLAIKHGRELGSEQVPIVIDELLNMHRGQGLDIMWRECRTCPTQHQYVQMVRDKTGGLFRLAVRLLMSFDTKAKPVLPLVEMMGVYFQVRDDLINVAWPKYMDEKSYCEDLTEGKFSFPIIHYMHHAQDSARLLYLLGEGIVDIDVKKVVMKWVRETGSLKYTFCYLTDLKTAIDAEIEKLGGNQHLVKLLDKLHDGVQECVL